MLPPELEGRLHARGIELLAEAPQHWLLTRGNCIALVERTKGVPGSIGSTGLMLAEGGLAYLVVQDGRERLRGKAVDREAAPEERDAIRAFSTDLRQALEFGRG